MPFPQIKETTRVAVEKEWGESQELAGQFIVSTAKRLQTQNPVVEMLMIAQQRVFQAEKNPSIPFINAVITYMCVVYRMIEAEIGIMPVLTMNSAGMFTAEVLRQAGKGHSYLKELSERNPQIVLVIPKVLALWGLNGNPTVAESLRIFQKGYGLYRQLEIEFEHEE